jgi:hypothetical protein
VTPPEEFRQEMEIQGKRGIYIPGHVARSGNIARCLAVLLADRGLREVWRRL